MLALDGAAKDPTVLPKDRRLSEETVASMTPHDAWVFLELPLYLSQTCATQSSK